MKKNNPSRFFRDDYPTARAAFLLAADDAGLTHQERYENPIGRGPRGETLTVDLVRDGPADARAILLITSGLHGIEGFAGSAIQARTLSTGALSPLPDDMAVIYVHALNPHGFAYERRVNENNVDLNRNFINWGGPMPPPHRLTSDLYDILLPDQWEWPSPRFMDLLQKEGLKTIQTAVSQGQYNFPDGLFYGGDRAEWSNMMWRDIIKTNTAKAEFIAHVDIHTGLGPYGHGTLLISKPDHDPMATRARNWWGEDVFSTADEKSIGSDLSGSIRLAFDHASRPVEHTEATLEFGTLSPTDVLEALALDNWAHAQMNINADFLKNARKKMRDAFAPNDPTWHKALLERGEEVLNQAKDGLIRSLKNKPL